MQTPRTIAVPDFTGAHTLSLTAEDRHPDYPYIDRYVSMLYQHGPIQFWHCMTRAQARETAAKLVELADLLDLDEAERAQS